MSLFRYISLFSGIGGFDLGFDRAGMRCQLQVEKDDKARAVLAHHWPSVPKMELVQDVTRDAINQLGIETVDLICGGFPCQDLSVAGQRKGLAGERSGLWFEFLRVIEEVRPGWVVIENVPGLLSSNGGRDMGTILGGLGECGYWWAYRVLDSQYFGVPQRRRRVFIVASTRKFAPQEVLFERDSSPWDTPPGREAGARVAAPTQNGAPGTFQNTGQGWWNESSIAQSLRTPEGGGSLEANLVAHSVQPRSGMPQGWNSNLITNAFNGYTGGPDDNDAQAHHLVVGFDQSRGQYTGDIAAPLRVNGAVKPGVNDGKPDNMCVFIQSVAPTLSAESYSPTKSSSGQQVDYCIYNNPLAGVRRLTPLECERLQGFPDGWTDIGQSDSARYRQLGNAVTVPVIEWIGHRIMKIKELTQ